MSKLKFCKHGHPWNFTNTSWFKRADGRSFRACKACRNFAARLRYRNDPIYRKRHKTQALARYHAERMS